MRITELRDHWQFKQADAFDAYYRPCVIGLDWLPATVPGHVDLDLFAAGVLPDPLTKLHEHGRQWVDMAQWSYRTSIEFTPDPAMPRRVLQFEGLDTVCSIWLNGERIGSSSNMFVPLEIDVTATLKPGTNELRVEFDSSVAESMRRRDAYFLAEGLKPTTTFFDERAFVRKAQYMSGWDWGPRIASCGIWRPVRLLEFGSRIKEFRVQSQPLPNGAWRVWSETTVDGEASYTTHFEGVDYKGDFDVALEAPELWWPNNEGAQRLYEASVTLDSGETRQKKIGLRTIELRREADAFGESFTFVVNGRPIFARGANWIPNDSLPSRITDAQIWESLSKCAELNMNMLRVWGGGLYESEAFYNACDALGLLVWQDFPFACSYYPENPEFVAEVRREAEFQVRRLRDRASLALWCGNNECQTMWEGKWGAADDQPGRYYGAELYDAALPEVLSENGPGTPYVPSSPIGSDPNQKPDCNGGRFGDQHYWDAWHGRGDWTYYQESEARFCSEFGFASSCGAATWRLAFEGEPDVEVTHAIARGHDKTNKPWQTFSGLVELHYPPSASLAEWTKCSQLNQRDALRFAIERFRANDFCKGTLIWQWNDCWPVQSWAVEDYARELKPAGRELKRLYAPALLAVVFGEGYADIWAINDSPERLVATALGYHVDLQSGSKNLACEALVELEPGQRRQIARLEAPLEKTTTALQVEFKGVPESATRRFWVEPKELANPDWME